MVSDAEFKQALKVIDRNTRLCLLYFSEHIDKRLEVHSTLQTDHRTLIDTKVSQLEKQVGTWQSTFKNLEVFEVRIQALSRLTDETEGELKRAKALIADLTDVDEKRDLIEDVIMDILDHAIRPDLTAVEEAIKENSIAVKKVLKDNEDFAKLVVKAISKDPSIKGELERLLGRDRG